ncbi:hypothetical protein K474DRAFT_1082435 [Panus rudis PR-1116 ss-1]|nr:hypothetical protein K474DRAFT_1082435 [Panus rudis PR-1116 ss-1]
MLTRRALSGRNACTDGHPIRQVYSFKFASRTRSPPLDNLAMGLWPHCIWRAHNATPGWYSMSEDKCQVCICLNTWFRSKTSRYTRSTPSYSRSDSEGHICLPGLIGPGRSKLGLLSRIMELICMLAINTKQIKANIVPRSCKGGDIPGDHKSPDTICYINGILLYSVLEHNRS